MKKQHQKGSDNGGHNRRQFIEFLKLIKDEEPKRADAIIWVQGDRYARARKVLSLWRRKYANRIVLSGNNELAGLHKRPGENNIDLVAMAAWLQRKGVKSQYIVIDDRSLHAEDQAENVLRLAAANKWDTIILVASLYHQIRLFLTFLKQAKKIGWKGRLINQACLLNLESMVPGRGKLGRELVYEEMKKIRSYKSGIASYKDGISYLIHRSIENCSCYRDETREN